MALTNDQITAKNFKDFYDQIYPFLGGGGGGTGGGHTIQDDGTDMTARDNLNFVGMEVDDNDSDGSTDVTEHRLTSAEISEMMGGIPNPTPRYPILFDERGTEYQVGWYILSNGTKKPVYRRDSQGSGDISIVADSWTDVTSYFGIDTSNIDKIVDTELRRTNKDFTNGLCVSVSDNKLRIWYGHLVSDTMSNGRITLYYTKTTDTPV